MTDRFPCVCLTTSQVTSSFTSSRDLQGFALTDRDDQRSVADDLTVNARSQQLVRRSPPPGEFYWQLPAKFLGNKVTFVIWCDAGFTLACWFTS